ncbi:MAG TPA: zf-HC2 domain-containing protein [Thermomicrobiales bacterium]|nr:zf-HC2 domain-containing protein [Thermomicrobiales bacterium]
MDTTELSCQELVAFVTDYFERALPSEEARRFEAHLADCDGCTTYLEQMRQTIDLLGRLREDDLQPAARDRLLVVFRNWRRS